MTKTFVWNDATGRIDVGGGSVEDPVTFKDIVDHFEASPMDPDWSLPRVFGGVGTDPYELTEGNAVNWFGLNGMGTPSDDGVDYHVGAESITATMATVAPAGVNITRVQTTVTVVRIYVDDISSFAVGDEVMIQGTTNFDGLMCRVTFVHATYIQSTTPARKPIVDETGITGATLHKMPSLAFNEDHVLKPATLNSASLADKIKFSAKADSVGTVKIVGIASRGSWGATSTNFNSQGTIKTDLTLTSSWQDFELDIREDLEIFHWPPRATARGYWHQLGKVYVMFDGLAVGDEVWLDGFRYVCSDRNPKLVYGNNYVFSTGLYVAPQCIFKDQGFVVTFNMLDMCGLTSSVKGYSFLADNLGDIQLGGYTGDNNHGGVFMHNAYSTEAGGICEFRRVQCQGITFMGIDDHFGWGFIQFLVANQLRDCNFIGMLNMMTHAHVEMTNCSWAGGRYFMAMVQDGFVVNGMTVYRVTNQPIYQRASADWLLLKDLIFVDDRSNVQTVHSDTYSSTEVNRKACGLINADVSQMGSGAYMSLNNLAMHDFAVESMVGITFQPIVQSVEGLPIDGATVKVYDKDMVEVVNTTTDSNGTITEQILNVLIASAPAKSGHTNFYFDTPTVDWEYYFPFTFTITADGYDNYNGTIMEGGYSRFDSVAKNGFNETIALKPVKKIRQTIDGELFSAVKPEIGSSAKLLKL